VLKMLAEIAAHDPRAAALAEEVFAAAVMTAGMWPTG
jgi:hypothetical protein